ncbi:glycosyltransferase family 4 protein [Candidatus Bathyarchaeota archaeon A05DMB-2]|jgi:glycosyltransferase involved in cell wall biosynthesis|nr:glycosyltransferase family 4 protein [Candidatus Bathyarchaeota archaeon A05DMB-2]
MPKVCFISPEYVPLSGGTGAYVYYLSNELMKHGYSICVVTGYSQAGDVQVNEKLSVLFLRTSKTPIVKSFLFAGSSFRKLNSVRDGVHVDIVHANLPLVPSFAVPSNFGKTLISTVHSTWKGEAEAIRGEPYSRLNSNEKFMVSFNWFLRIFEESMLKRSNKIIAVSDFTRRELLQYYKVREDKIRVIHNGVDTNKFQPASDKRKAKQGLGFNPDGIAILSVGRLYARKGLFTLIESMPAVVRRFPRARFIISGKGQSDEMKKLVAHAQKLGVNDKIVFTGYYPDRKLPRLYQAADVFAFSTFYENLPFAVLEALSTGLPVVTTRVGGIPEMIEDGRNGFLVQPFNARELSDRILYFLEHPSAASEMAFLARKVIEERFDWRLIVKKVLRVYDEALG